MTAQAKLYEWDIFVGRWLCESCYRREADLVQTRVADGRQRIYCAECVTDGLKIVKGEKPRKDMREGT